MPHFRIMHQCQYKIMGTTENIARDTKLIHFIISFVEQSNQRSLASNNNSMDICIPNYLHTYWMSPQISNYENYETRLLVRAFPNSRFILTIFAKAHVALTYERRSFAFVSV
jgi:hypothetical protein